MYIFNKVRLITGQLPHPHTNIFAPSLTLYLNVHSNYEIHLSLSLSLSPSLSTSLTVGLLVGQSGGLSRRSVIEIIHKDDYITKLNSIYVQKVLNDFNVYDSLKHTFESLLTFLIKDGVQQ